MSRLPVALILAMLGTIRPSAQTLEAIAQPAPDLGAFQGRQTTPPPPAAPPSTPAPGLSRTDRQPMPSENVKIEVTIGDTFGSTPARKTVTMLVADLRTGRIRSALSVGVLDREGHTIFGNIGINVDATPEVRPDGGILLQLSVQYTPERADVIPSAGSGLKPADINESITAVLADGKPTLLSQSADPQGDRKVTLEVTATIVK
jgi:hypothetical protein